MNAIKEFINLFADPRLFFMLGVAALVVRPEGCSVTYTQTTTSSSALESFVKENLTDYYCSDEGWDDFQTNYLEMKEIRGDE